MSRRSISDPVTRQTSPRERDVQSDLVEALRSSFSTCWILVYTAHPKGRRGVPDILACINGLFVAIEVKRDKSKRPTALQRYELHEIGKAGGHSYICHGTDGIPLVVAQIMEDLKRWGSKRKSSAT